MATDVLDADEQDLAEVFDETNLTRDGEDIAHPDVAADVFDVTRAADDTNDDAYSEDAEDFDPDLVDDAELEEMLEMDDGIDGPRAATADPGDLVLSSAPGPDEEDADEEDRDLDEDLEDTFPASDPTPTNPGAD
ncbi:MAG: primosomal protein [Caulobacteraceae bacterium]|nr:primosomal protein [Caulobacteraceae bacterium]